MRLGQVAYSRQKEIGSSDLYERTVNSPSTECLLPVVLAALMKLLMAVKLGGQQGTTPAFLGEGKTPKLGTELF